MCSRILENEGSTRPLCKVLQARSVEHGGRERERERVSSRSLYRSFEVHQQRHQSDVSLRHARQPFSPHQVVQILRANSVWLVCSDAVRPFSLRSCILITPVLVVLIMRGLWTLILESKAIRTAVRKPVNKSLRPLRDLDFPG